MKKLLAIVLSALMILTVLLGFHQRRHAAALGDGHFNVLVSGHHSAESFALGSHRVLGDGALGDGIGAGQRQRGDQTDDRQHQECGQLLLVLHACCLQSVHIIYDAAASGVENVDVNVAGLKKQIIDGQLVIIRDGKAYNTVGAQVK